MDHSKDEILRVVFQAYSLDILRSLATKPKRFNELRKEVKTKRTLALKLDNLLDYGLIELVPIKAGKRYANYYKTSQKGKRLIDQLGTVKF